MKPLEDLKAAIVQAEASLHLGLVLLGVKPASEEEDVVRDE